MHRDVLTTLAALLMSIAGPGLQVSYGVVVVAFGDSTTAVRSTVPEVYAQLLQDQLPGLLGKSVTVYNAGVGGDNTNGAVSRLNADVRLYHPDWVIVQFGLNDCWVDTKIQGNPSRVPIATYTSNLNYIVSTLKSDGAKVILMTTNQTNTDSNYPNYYPQWQEDLLSSYNQQIRSVAASQGVRLLDVWNMYSAYMAVPGHSVNDLLVDQFEHPNQAGHTMVANGLTAMIAPEPGTLILLIAAGLSALACGRLRRRRS